MTPGRLKQRAALYHEIGSLVTAGVPLIGALQGQRERAPPAFRRPLGAVVAGLEAGMDFARALEEAGDWMPAFDRALLRAGEQSGRLDACLQLLADYYEGRAEVARSIISGAIYPAIVVHLALLIFPVNLLSDALLKGQTGALLAQKALAFGLLYGLVAAFVFVATFSYGEGARALIEKALGGVPVLGSARRDLALARLAISLQALLAAGVNAVQAWALAVEASASPRLRREVANLEAAVDAGETPGALLAASRAFPDLFANLYRSGEISGGLEEALGRIYRYYQDAGSARMRALGAWVPRLLYFGVVIAVGWQIISFYNDYFGQIGDLLR